MKNKEIMAQPPPQAAGSVDTGRCREQLMVLSKVHFWKACYDFDIFQI